MSAAFTPGPWRVSPEHPTIIRRDFRPISDEGELIGSAAGYDNSGFFPSDSEALANARLIAAAPELLEALQAIYEACDGYVPNTSKAAWNNARLAILKATGEQA